VVRAAGVAARRALVAVQAGQLMLLELLLCVVVTVVVVRDHLNVHLTPTSKKNEFYRYFF